MSILNDMGNTPLVKLKNPFGDNYAQVYLKMEEFNPGGSIKSRVALQMIEDAEIAGILNPGATLIEPTGGNTGIGLAVACSLKGYQLVLTIPDNFSAEKIEVLKKYGAKVTLADHRIGNDCHIKKARELLKDNPDWICLNQFENPSNPKAHYLYTANEIIEQLNTPIDCFVSVIGSGGTITGISKRLKEYNPEIKIIGVEPKGCNILNNIYIPHKIQATAVGKVGNFFDKSMINEMVSVDFEEVQKIRNYLSFNQGIFVGISSGANVLAAFNESKKWDSSKTIVTIAPDSGRSYLELFNQ
ncbi:PLP-dependent cysteine synthase family protein [Streptococcus infantarius]|jgi:cysteine synthase A|uniref:PLP-dependent cysteine synthase family protein n=1 Tax=Streptococcus TaxID=1301 RepID=UPI0012DD274B|nr:cysteine synthase family protein [Streptococcus ruminantium]MCO4500240.1 cysteine synthetase [Streptococcus infantarius subsp. infantarius]HEL1558010.1 cysteine synthase family protein [Streptococcus suis]HEM6519449.1 cysteine synthase family protein [Streptococcus suis]HEM6520830.1 cysteine synthase family protein [Streptococcus suis]